MNFGERLYQLRTGRGIYQRQLAEYLQVSIGTISNYENSIHLPDLDTLCKFAEYFQVTTDYLLDLTDNTLSVDCLNIELADGYTIGSVLNTIAALPRSSRKKIVKYLTMIQTCDEELPRKNQMLNRQKQMIERQGRTIVRQAREIGRLKEQLEQQREGAEENQD
ncbi:MAG: helix-turn-helix domain-containing protein [bacterium]|nr:helix-turn-helix domain-containing protein [bacterium]MCM1374625.1 helix-turn-helix domain-containing protein [Muribaculum sp.]